MLSRIYKGLNTVGVQIIVRNMSSAENKLSSRSAVNFRKTNRVTIFSGSNIIKYI